MVYDWTAHREETRRQGEERAKTNLGWVAGDMIRFGTGTGLCIGVIKQGVVWLHNDGAINVSNPKNDYLFTHRVALNYSFFDTDQLRKDFVKGYFNSYF